MTYLIGTDEAGYGPNLGPLVISASVWEVAGAGPAPDLYQVLADAVARRRPGRNSSGKRKRTRATIADSKALYKSGDGLGALEAGVLAVLACADVRPDSWQPLWRALDPAGEAERSALPWHANYDPPLPCDAARDEIESLAAALRGCCLRAGARFVAAHSTAVFPQRFNALVAEHGSKGAALSRLTLELIATAMAGLPDGGIDVACDKHGGRNCYGPLLQDCFPEHFVEVRRESRPRSTYRFGPPGRRVEIHFRAGGEAYLPAALASMISKYLRELAMRPFNDFWRRHVPELRPTAGYPVDARRFHAAIAAAQRTLAIEDAMVWRCR
jgi:hypothetical protein